MRVKKRKMDLKKARTNGDKINVKMLETYGTTQAVDIPEDVDKVLEILNERKS